MRDEVARPARPGKGPWIITWLAFVAGIAASLAANVAHANPTTGARFVAGWAPLALLLTIEVMMRVPAPRSRVLTVLRYGSTVAVAGVAAVASFRHMRGLALAYGEDILTANTLPLSVDGLIVVASIALITLADRRHAATTGIPGKGAAEQRHAPPAVPAVSDRLPAGRSPSPAPAQRAAAPLAPAAAGDVGAVTVGRSLPPPAGGSPPHCPPAAIPNTTTGRQPAAGSIRPPTTGTTAPGGTRQAAMTNGGPIPDAPLPAAPTIDAVPPPSTPPTGATASPSQPPPPDGTLSRSPDDGLLPLPLPDGDLLPLPPGGALPLPLPLPLPDQSASPDDGLLPLPDERGLGMDFTPVLVRLDGPTRRLYVAAYRHVLEASAAGTAVSGRDVGARCGRSERWGRDRIAEVRAARSRTAEREQTPVAPAAGGPVEKEDE